MWRVDSGTSDTPSPAATKLTSVAVSDTSCATRGRKPWAAQVSSIASWIGLPSLAWVEGPAGAWASLVPLAVIAWLLVRLPLGHARRV